METKTLNQLKGSENHKIIAAVLEIMEKVNIDTQIEAKLQQKKEDEQNWKMDFLKKDTNLTELNGIKQELGKNFTVTLTAKDSKNLLISVEAPAADFISLLQRKQSSDVIPSRGMFDKMPGNEQPK